ncbi:MAG: tetratricopeptide repeat protein [Phycisphaerae bacterium]|nr:tetratricopeptide repeat protein [Phycisphaerae bacterium]
MEQAVADALASIAMKETWTVEDYRELVEQLSATTDATKALREILADLEAQNPASKGGSALKIGIGRFMLCRFNEALEALGLATDNKDRRYFAGQCYRSMRKHGKAIEEFQRAKDKGWDGPEVDVLIVEMLALGDQLDAANKAYAKISASLGESADFYYLKGLLLEMAGRGEDAIEAYDTAREHQEDHPEATFRLAYYLDLHGEEEEAVELYEDCLNHPSVYVSALLNLAVLYEDSGHFNLAISTLQKLLDVCPDHPRARLFLRDAEASTHMLYDEDRARRIAKHSAVLDIPVTDFELSVRARNCLKKMNIMTLGDLVSTSEAELLGYKNFGETSLKEIKDMLTAKRLRLGQALEEQQEALAKGIFGEAEQVPEEEQGVMGILISQVEFSVRARRVLEQLNVRSLGDLAAKSEAELMGQKNFGQTSLSEMRQRLAENGLSFRNSE